MGTIGTLAKGAAAIGGRVGASLVGGPIGTAIGVATSVPLLIDMVRSFMDGGEHNADPKAIAAQRDKVMAELTKNGKSPEQARAMVDELLRPLVEETGSSRDSKPTSGGELLADSALAVAGIIGGRRFGKGKAKGAPHDNPMDGASPAPEHKMRKPGEPPYGAEHRPDTSGPEPISDNYDRRPRSMGEYDDPEMSDGFDQLMQAAALKRLHGRAEPLSPEALERAKRFAGNAPIGGANTSADYEGF